MNSFVFILLDVLSRIVGAIVVLVVLYYVITAIAYGVTRSVMEAVGDHKKRRNKNGSKTAEQ